MTRRRPDVECYSDPRDLVRVAAERVVAAAIEAIARRGRFLFCLAGGTTPEGLYQLLARAPFAEQIEWPRVHIFWGDERCVPPDHLASNYRMAHQALLDGVPLPAGNVHRIRGEDDPAVAAQAYEALLGTYFGDRASPPSTGFDLVLLGMGSDGHTASLFPGSPAALEPRRWVVVSEEPQAGGRRVSLTPAMFNAAENVTFLVRGADKAERLKDVLEDRRRDLLPAQLIQPTHGVLRWMIDSAAGARLRAETVTWVAANGTGERSHQ